MSNLISNAIKYQKKFDTHTPVISISSTVRNENLDIEIADNGEGIREEYQGKLFNMFYRGTASSSGSGLGLYIAKEAIQKLHGKITFTSRLGEGSTFRISIPHLKNKPRSFEQGLI
ncbi:MAG: HAMP domain-containing histidine kinase [Bacteroidia bacterium]|nr:HAMP domain-containing histidine kinase [Bacteroidia bacterium]